MYSKRAIIIIPARYGSTRFPGKPLVDLNKRPQSCTRLMSPGRSAASMECMLRPTTIGFRPQ
ncbi:hypothetical protein [Mesorhizobium sp. M1348]|uniref:cytidylyltransferase domain-containing protein n=1 Tax=Mesorhizobium sp. M1348 TaxID=2957089 RepID=UPI00333B4182